MNSEAIIEKAVVALVIGTRPEAIKMAPVRLALKLVPTLTTVLISTGQHRTMVTQILDAFDMVLDRDLGLGTPGQTLNEIASRALAAIDAEFAKVKPDLVLTQGDTTTAFAATLAAFHRNIPVGHVEAGLRTGNLRSPFPEEANRVLISRLASLHFCPTADCRTTLLGEGVADATIFVTGNPVIDAVRLIGSKLDAAPVAVPGLADDVLAGGKPLVLITAHRRENFGSGFENICNAVIDSAERRPAVNFVYPVHLNPNVREPVERLLASRRLSNVHLIEPLGYLEFQTLFRRAAFVLSDSGGVQEEATAHGKIVLLMRDTTERPEAVASGHVRLVGLGRDGIVAAVAALLDNPAGPTSGANPYGDGRAGEAIAAIVSQHLKRQAI